MKKEDILQLHYILFSVIAGGMIGLLFDFLSKPWLDFNNSVPTAVILFCSGTSMCNVVSYIETSICSIFAFMNPISCKGVLSNLIIYSFALFSIILLIILFVWLTKLEDKLKLTKKHLLFTILISTVPFFITIRLFAAFLWSFTSATKVQGDIALLVIYSVIVFGYYEILRASDNL